MKFDQTNASMPASPAESTGTRWRNQVWNWTGRHPVLAILAVSLLAVAVNCYPVIFCGRSFVSPNCVQWMVYDWSPPVPGMAPARYQFNSQHGSDTGSIMWWGIPAGFIESRSLLDHGELPLWNRYSHAGDSLIGQAVSMLGDPLQLIVILGRGSAGAWDVKYLAAKLLFCVGFGVLILRLVGSRPMALIYAALAAYCGAYFYIFNHPAFFVLTYAPWILVSALAWFDFRSGRPVWWGLVWLLANFACFNAGHVEVAVVLIGGLNLAAAVQVLSQHRKPAELATAVARIGVGTLLFLGLTAPVWMSFLAGLAGAYTTHAEIQATQLPPAALLGAFDDLFFLLPLKSDAYAAIAPGTSLLIMVGTILSALRWRQLKGETFFWVNGGAILLWGGCVFGWIPNAVLAAVPLLNRVGHVYTEFSYLLVLHLTIQSAFGFLSVARESRFRAVAVDLVWVALVLAVMVLIYHLGMDHRPIPWDYFACVTAGAIGAPLLFAYLKIRDCPISATGWAGVIVLGFIANFRFGLYAGGKGELLMQPGPREVLNAPSQAIEKIQAEQTQPFRVAGMGWNLAGDYFAVYGIEDIRSCAPLSNGDYIKLIQACPGLVFGGEGGWGICILNPVLAQPLLNMLGVRYLLTDPSQRAEVRKGVDFRITDRSDFLVLENLQVWPRAFFTDKIAVNTSNAEFMAQLQANAKQPFASLSPDEISRQPGLSALENRTNAVVVPATRYRLLPNSTAFDIRAPAAGVVCLIEGQAKDFRASANHEPRKVLTVNRAFKAVYLDKPGDYHIEFVYRPRHWGLACFLFWISLVGAVALAAFITLRARSWRNAREPGLIQTT